MSAEHEFAHPDARRIMFAAWHVKQAIAALKGIRTHAGRHRCALAATRAADIAIADLAADLARVLASGRVTHHPRKNSHDHE